MASTTGKVRIGQRRVKALVSVALIVAGLGVDFAAVRANEVEQRPPDPWVAVEVEPKQIVLSGSNRRQQILVTAHTRSGRLVDVTHTCSMRLADERAARLSGTALVAIGDGSSELTVEHAGVRRHIAVRIELFDVAIPVHFQNDVIPLLSKLGCNSGGCHGKASGQNGFKLSVFGFDPQADFVALTREGRGRRVFPGDPESSLLIRKAIGLSVHGGGRRTEHGSDDHGLLARWVQQGASWGRDDASKVTRIEVIPADRVVARNAQQQLLVTAHYSDGSRRDVTPAAAYTSNAVVVADVDPHGLVHTGEVPGEAAITISYLGHVAAARALVPRVALPQTSPDPAENNRIDGFVWSKLRRMGIVPSDLCTDSIFLRRVFLDTIGTLPTPEEARAFLADQRPEKRLRLIDTVLEREEFADLQALRWADILLVDRNSLGERGAFEFHHWLREQIAGNRPYNEWVYELVTATGNSGKYGPVNFYRALKTPDDLTRAVSQAFLGIRLDCAQCHHHPFEKWGQEDFYGLAGFFNGLQRKPLSPTRDLVFHGGYRETLMPLTGQRLPTRPPDGDPIDVSANDPRVQLASWLTSPRNPWFARLAANRLWKQYLGRGLVDPVDDLRSTNPAVNEPLLDWLTQQVVEHGFDLKAVMRLIMNSRVYQLSSQPNDTNALDEQNFSHFVPRRLAAEVLLDAVCQVTEVPETFAGMPSGTRSIQIWDNRLPSYFLDTFGRSERKSPCECGKSGEPTMSQALHLMNAPEVQAKVVAERGRAARLAASDASPDGIIDELCLAAWSRYPTAKERAIGQQFFMTSSRQRATEDFLWTLLNSYEFLFVR